MAEYLRFQLNTPADISLSSMIGSFGAHCVKLNFQKKVRDGMPHPVQRRFQTGSRQRDNHLNQHLDNINYLYDVAARGDVSELPEFPILSEAPNRAESRLPLPEFPKLSYLDSQSSPLSRSDAILILRARTKGLNVGKNKRADALCPVCGICEDEGHVLEVCPRFDHIRAGFHVDDIRFNNAFSDDPEVLIRFAKFAREVENQLCQPPP